MKLRARIILLAVIILSSCEQKIPAPDKIDVPEFIDVKYDFGTFLENRYVVLSASLSTDNGVKEAGFMIGFNETSLSFKQADIKDLTISVVLNYLDYDTEYCFYARASNGMNEVRTRMIIFRTPKKGEPFVPGDNTENGSNGNDEPDKEPEPPTPVMPPEGVAITISDDNFLAYLSGICDRDNDGLIMPEEAAAVQNIEVCTDDIRTLDGISYCTSLRTLIADGTVWKGKLTALSLEYNIALEVLSCKFNHISSFLLPPSLIELDMRFNNVSEPDFSTLKNLRKLDCFGCDITRLNLKALVSLEELVCGMNMFETLDVSNNLNLKFLDLSDSPNLKIVYVARGQKIQTIIAENRIEFKYKE